MSLVKLSPILQFPINSERLNGDRLDKVDDFQIEHVEVGVSFIGKDQFSAGELQTPEIFESDCINRHVGVNIYQRIEISVWLSIEYRNGLFFLYALPCNALKSRHNFEALCFRIIN